MDRRAFGSTIFVAAILCVVAACLFSPLRDWLSVSALRDSQVWLASLVEARPYVWAAGFFSLCVVATALCFPAAPVLGLSGGALFGFWPGMVIVTIASSIGSTIAFFDSRYLLRSWVKRKLGRRIQAIDEGVEKHGALYLLVLRLNPVIPYWLVNLAMGLTAMRAAIYVPLTAAGLAPATFIYVQAGTRLADFGSGGDLIPIPLLASLFVISLIPVYLRMLARFEPAA
ncbi:MAG TPA: TVP38/TMEM64 family protein [Sphingomicrobium sp.]|nr:TVP38/TMEM64 family protein [Sphingomicrobium sp.]